MLQRLFTQIKEKADKTKNTPGSAAGVTISDVQFDLLLCEAGKVEWRPKATVELAIVELAAKVEWRPQKATKGEHAHHAWPSF